MTTQLQIGCGLEEAQAHTHGDGCFTTQLQIGCGQEEAEPHFHAEACWMEQTTVICTTEESEEHTHGAECMHSEKILLCAQPETEGHTHSDSCNVEVPVQTCTLAQTEGHTHSDGCMVEVPVQTCTLAQTEGHTHSDSCMVEVPVQTCTLAQTEGHTHSDSCNVEVQVQICNLEQSQGHSHSESCQVETRTLSCTLAETEGHAHGEACVQPVRKQICDTVETEGHIHNETCGVTEKVLTCTLETAQPHIHNEVCTQTEEELICTEQEGHTHSESCFVTGETLVCQLPEIGAHTHEEACFDENGTLICTTTPAVVHDHTEACWIRHEPEQILLCEKEIHIHSEECFPKEETVPEDSPYLCGMGIHSHVETCYDETETLICTVPVHEKHTAACLVEDFDETADLESQEIWEATLADVKLTGNWPTDVLAIADSQLGYTESTRNMYLDEAGKLTGYSRYGAWYGSPYGDWCAMFTSFCMHYAGVEDVPLGAGCTTWIGELTEAGLYREAGEYEPKPGDLIFFDWEYTEGAALDSDHVGFVAEVIPATDETPARIITIEGNSSEQVEYNTYDLPDTTIIGYGEMPAGENRILIHRGEDYTVTTIFSVEAGIPENAQLQVEEILPGTEEYDAYYLQSLAQMVAQGTAESEEDLAISFARFFDISFLVDGEKVEPTQQVNIQIAYDEAVNMATGSGSVAVHFASDGIEILDALTTQTEEDPNLIDSFEFAQNSFSVTGTMLVQARAPGEKNLHVWVDASNGGLMAYSGASNTYYKVAANETFTLPLQEEITGPRKYSYRLQGWYNIKNDTYYLPGEDVVITENAVFYADWVAATYDVGTADRSVESVDTHEFVTTYVFDYNTLFNLQSVVHTGNVSDKEHTETWTFVRHNSNPNTVFRNNELYGDGIVTLNFYFHDWDATNDLSFPGNVDDLNDLDENHITSGIVQHVDSIKAGRTLTDVLFNPATAFDTTNKDGILGKTYVGEGNYLFQYMEEGMENYDGEHNGYYYYDSKLNAASYNQSEERFYVYDYLERTATSAGQADDLKYSDFLPFNSYLVNTNGQSVMSYQDPSGVEGYQFDSEGDNNGEAGTNFHFGINTNIHFYLPNDCGESDEYGNLGNLSTTGEHMVFEFHGDDDVWVFVDEYLLLDLGGVHAALGGTIDFSRGVVTTEDRDGNVTTQTFEQILGEGRNILEGPHNLRFYYLERGSSMSNCAIYFNLAPRYSLELEKQDYFTGELLDGATFGVFTEESCTPESAAQLWETHEEAKNNPNGHRNEFTVSGGKLKMFGLVAGTTYYIKEITEPEGYIDTDDIIRISLNNRGLSTSEVTVLRGANNIREDGFEVISNYLNEDTQTVHLVITNQEDTSNNLQIRVEKKWADGSISIPGEVTVYLLANGARSGRDVQLNAQNGWAHTWLALPETDSEGNPIVYSVEEIGVPGFSSQVGTAQTRESIVVWTKVGIMEDGESYMLVKDGSALALDPTMTTFSWVSTDVLENSEHDYSYIWHVTASGDGFILTMGEYKLTLDGTSRYIMSNGSGNQVLHFDGNSIFGLNTNIQYELADISGGNPQAVAASESSGGLDLELMRRDNYSGTIQMIDVINTPIPEELQTALTVKKEWDTDEDVSTKYVIVKLFADDEDTGRTLTLNQGNSWTGTFDGLAMYQADGVTPVAYTVQEIKIDNYVDTYSEVTLVPGSPYTVWATKSTLEEGNVYHLTYGGYALGISASNALTAVAPDADNTNQQWTHKNGMLYNEASGRYLTLTGSGNRYTLGTGTGSGTAVTLDVDGRLVFTGTGRYLTVTGSALSTTSNQSNATTLLVYEQTTLISPDTYAVTVTNVKGVYNLPATGSTGTQSFTFGGLLIVAAALAYLLISRTRRREEQS